MTALAASGIIGATPDKSSLIIRPGPAKVERIDPPIVKLLRMRLNNMRPSSSNRLTRRLD
jgi:hypothetical protein